MGGVLAGLVGVGWLIGRVLAWITFRLPHAHLSRTGDGLHVEWLTRSPRFFPLEYTKPTLEMTSPDYVDHFTSLPQEVRDRLGSSHAPLYKGVNAELLDRIYDMLYEASVHGPAPATLRTSTALLRADRRRLDEAGVAVLPLRATLRDELKDAAEALGRFNQALDASPDLLRLVKSPAFSAEEQGRGLAAVLKTIEPSFLEIPRHIIPLIPPRPVGYGATVEIFQRNTGSVFDVITPAAAAADMTLSLVLDPDRASRLVEERPCVG